ncbi:hypothetical protein AOLI_G00105110 [Acnodon oligacanthus]
MVNHCCVSGCRSEAKRTTKRFHRFPKDLSVCRLWLSVIKHRLASENISRDSVKNLRVCSDHFLPEDYRERSLNNSLNASAVPSVFSWNLPRGSESEVFSDKEGTASVCSEVEERSWRKAVKGLQTNPGTSIYKCNEVLVSTQCLLELFQYCSLCQIESCITIEGHERQFSITQDCQSCGYHREWRSHPTPADEPEEALNTQHKDPEEAIHEEVEDAASYPETECTPEPGEEDSEEVVIQIVSSDNEGTEQNSERVALEKNESYLSSAEEKTSEHSDMSKDEGFFIVHEVEKRSTRKRKCKRQYNFSEVDVDSDEFLDEDLFGAEEEEKKESGKRKSKRQDSSDEWEPRLDEVAADSDVSMDEDLFNTLTEDGQGKVVVWCTVCKTDATLSCSLRHHKKVFACAQCGAGDDAETHSFEKLTFRFNNFASFQKHAEKEHGAKQLHTVCQECGKLVLSEPKSSGRKDHKCEKAKSIVCPECGKRFLTEVGLKRHFSKLHKDADHPCKYCLKLFTNRPSKLEHEQTHPKEKQPYSCPDCPERFDNIHKRNSHLKLHRGPYKYACDTCGKRFRDIIMLKRHKLIHSGEKPFRCQVCDRSFNQIGNLSSHMRLHTGEKPFMCEQCGECFNHNVSLKNHLMRYHYSGLSQMETQ